MFDFIFLYYQLSDPSRFGITDRRPHSAGGVYISFNKLHQRVRLLDFNIHLLMVLSGEPSTEDLNYVFEPFIPELKMLYIGITLPVAKLLS